MFTSGDKLLIGAECSNLDQQLRAKLPSDRFLVVRDAWIEESISSGTQAPILRHIVPLSRLTPAAMSAGKDGAHAPTSDSSLLQAKRRKLEHPSSLLFDEAASTVDDAVKRHNQSANTAIVPPPLPPPEAAEGGQAPDIQLSPAVLDALRVITGRRLWLPTQQQQQQHGGMSSSSIKQYQQQHQQDVLHFQQQQRPLPKLDVSWMPPTAFRVVSYNILADMYCSNK